jgi:hypothetical protein
MVLIHCFYSNRFEFGYFLLAFNITDKQSLENLGESQGFGKALLAKSVDLVRISPWFGFS